MKSLRVLVPISVALLAGCAAADMERRLTSWQGEPIDELVRVWDSPTSHVGNRYTWKQTGGFSVDRPVECLRIVDVDDKGIVQHLALQGDCKFFNLHYAPFGGNPKTTPALKRSL